MTTTIDEIRKRLDGGIGHYEYIYQENDGIEFMSSVADTDIRHLLSLIDAKDREIERLNKAFEPYSEMLGSYQSKTDDLTRQLQQCMADSKELIEASDDLVKDLQAKLALCRKALESIRDACRSVMDAGTAEEALASLDQKETTDADR